MNFLDEIRIKEKYIKSNKKDVYALGLITVYQKLKFKIISLRLFCNGLIN